ncbi:MAG: hypothetical protein C0467_28590 [Planctomycetaceae bacterium]|nr:hypothetical protein [Planctomycetaceae bacterium]
MNILLPTETRTGAGDESGRSQSLLASRGKSAIGQSLRSWLTGLILGGTWLCCFLAAWWLTAQTSPLVPKYDDWLVIVPVVTGHETVSPTWLWESLNEHKIPLPRLAYFVAVRCSGGDFRAGSFLSVLLLSLVSLGAMLVARRWRGTSSLADAFFPLLLLHWGQTHLFVVGSCLNFTIPLTLYYLVVFLVARPEGLRGASNYPVVTLLLGAMALCGLVGVVLAFAPLVWMGVIGLNLLRVEGRRHQACYCLTLVLGVAALMALNFRDFTCPHPRGWPAAALDPESHVDRMRILLAMSLGWLGEWKSSVAAAGIVTLSIATVWALGKAVVKSPVERERSAGMISLLCSIPLVMVSIGFGRSFLTVGALWGMTHYVALGVGFVAILYVTSLFCFPRRVGSLVRGSLFLVALLVFAGNLIFPDRYPSALQVIRRIRNQEDLLVQNLVAGQSLPQAAKAFFGTQTDDRPERGAAYLEMLSDSHMGPFSLSERKIKEGVDWWGPRRPEDRLVLTDPLARRYLGYGWSLAFATQGLWTCGPEATLRLQAHATTDRLLTIRLYPFLVAGKLDRQRLKLLLNGTPIWESVLDQARLYEQTIPLPGPLLKGRNVLLLQMPDATAPKALGVNLDPDEHAILLESVQIH